MPYGIDRRKNDLEREESRKRGAKFRLEQSLYVRANAHDHKRTRVWDMAQMLEKHLKFWLNNAYHGQLNFIEPTIGSSVGMPDVELPIGKETLPIETKIGTITRSGFLHVVLRPSQYRYHILAAERGQPTAILAAVGASTKFSVYAFAGRFVENDRYKDQTINVANWQRWTDIFDRNVMDKVWRSLIEGYAHA